MKKRIEYRAHVAKDGFDWETRAYDSLTNAKAWLRTHDKHNPQFLIKIELMYKNRAETMRREIIEKIKEKQEMAMDEKQ